MSVAIYDPAMGGADSFAMVTAQVTREKILITGAKFWNKKDITNLTTRQIKEEINSLNEKFHFDYHLCETNNMGHMVISDLRTDYKIPVIGITTAGSLKSANARRRINVLDKAKTIPWLQKFIEEGIIEFPKKLTTGLHTMKNEIDNYGVTQAGKYHALSGHDDSISCLVILTHWAKRKMLKSMTSKLFGYGSKSQYDDRTGFQKRHEKVLKRFEDAGMNTENMRIDVR